MNLAREGSVTYRTTLSSYHVPTLFGFSQAKQLEDKFTIKFWAWYDQICFILLEAFKQIVNIYIKLQLKCIPYFELKALKSHFLACLTSWIPFILFCKYQWFPNCNAFGIGSFQIISLDYKVYDWENLDTIYLISSQICQACWGKGSHHWTQISSTTSSRKVSLFVPQTPDSDLAMKVRIKEEENNQSMKICFLIVELG